MLGMTRRHWATKHRGKELDRRERLHKALAAAQRAGLLTLRHIDAFTDPQLIEAAEAAEANATRALKEAIV